MRLLPNRPEIGWTPYLWLIYLAQIPIGLVLERAGSLEWALSLVGMAVFLVLYFRGFWVDGRQLVPVVLGLGLLGLLSAPSNWAGTVYFIYAAAFAARLGPARLAWRWVLGLALAVVAVAAGFRIPLQGWLPGLIFTLLIGAISIFDRERGRIHNRLKLAQEDVERLAQVAERERIARDLHDVLGHSLSLITLKAELAARLIKTDVSRAEAEIREVERVARGALAQVRETVKGYRAAGIDAELTNARLACEAAELTLELEREPVAVGAAEENALALALREAVTNVIRHAAASQVKVGLRPVEGKAELSVEDNGRGGRLTEGSGLAGMRERVEALGGEVILESGRGVKLLIRVPLRERHELRLVGGAR